MKKYRVLISAFACNPLISGEAYPGEAILGYNLVKQLSKFFKLIVITWEFNQKTIENFKKQKEIKNIDFYYIGLPICLKILRKYYYGHRIYYWIWQIRAYNLAKKLQRKMKFDVAHQITFSNDWMPSYIGAYLKIPFIWGPVGGGQKVPAVLGRALPLKVRINEIARNFLQEFWRHTPTRLIGMKKAKAILVCNDETRKKVEKFSDKVYDFPVNGISYEELGFRDSDLGFSSQANHPNSKTGQQTNIQTDQQVFRVLFAGRFDPIKGIPLGIRAFSEFHRKNPESIFEIIGEGPDEKRIKKVIKKLNLDDSVKVLPWLTREKLLKRMCESDVLLFPSFRDGGGAVVVEAMASGIPVICLDIAGPGFHIRDEWGIKVKPKNPDYIVNEMANWLEMLYLNKNLKEEMGRWGRERAEDYCLWESLGNRLKEIYENILENK